MGKGGGVRLSVEAHQQAPVGCWSRPLLLHMKSSSASSTEAYLVRSSALEVMFSDWGTNNSRSSSSSSSGVMISRYGRDE